MRPTQVTIDLTAIRHNVSELAARSQNANLMAVVKANAYGHGAVPVSKAALSAGAVSLAVAIPEEGVELREAGIAVPIFILGLVLPEQSETVVRHRLITPVCTREGAASLSAEAIRQGRRAQVMVKVDTGMGRIGLPPNELCSFISEITQLPSLEFMGVFTHLASADAHDKTYAEEQLANFKQALRDMTAANQPITYLSAGNSATIIDLPDGHFNLVRAGIAMYGLPPSGEMHNRPNLLPAMQFTTKIVFIKHVAAGTKIGYGCTYIVPVPTYIATLPVGYADGYSRHLSNKAEVLIGGKRRKIVGRVCMDQIMADLGPVCDAKVGDEAVLFGRQGSEEITVTELANLTGTINYELICAVSARVPRQYVYE
jgi:alanine racemase